MRRLYGDSFFLPAKCHKYSICLELRKIFTIIEPQVTTKSCCSKSLLPSLGLVDTVFTMDSLIAQLELGAGLVERAERYELLGNLYRILVPIYEARRNYPALVQCYSHLYQVCSSL